MLRSSSYPEHFIMAEDVTIRCRVRRSATASNPEFGEPQEMTCTMRNWERGTGAGRPKPRNATSRGSHRFPTPPHNVRRGSLASSINSNNSGSNAGGGAAAGAAAIRDRRDYYDDDIGPELFLTPMREIITNRDESPVRRLSLDHHAQSSSATSMVSYSIPINDIMVVDTKKQPPRGSSTPINTPTHYTSTASNNSNKSSNNQSTGGSGGAAAAATSSSSSGGGGGGGTAQQQQQPPTLITPTTTPQGGGGGGILLNITTLSYGLFEFLALNQNGHDILLAFLKALLPAGRVMDGASRAVDEGGKSSGGRSGMGRKSTSTRKLKTGGSGSFSVGGGGSHRGSGYHDVSLKSSSSVTSCLDVDALTAAHLKGRSEHETWPEKMSRRVGKVVNSLSELSQNFCGAVNSSSFTCCFETEGDGHDPGHRLNHPGHRLSSASYDDAVRDKPPSSGGNANNIGGADYSSYNSNNRLRSHSSPRSSSRRTGGFSSGNSGGGGSSSPNQRRRYTTTTATTTTTTSTGHRSHFVVAGSGNSNGSIGRRPRSVPSSFHYSDLELDENDSQIPTDTSQKSSTTGTTASASVRRATGGGGEIAGSAMSSSSAVAGDPPPNQIRSLRPSSPSQRTPQQRERELEQMKYELCRKVSC